MLDAIISLFRDFLSGTRYIIYVLICLTLLFAIVGYMFKQKYGKVEFKMSTGKPADDQEKVPTASPKDKKVKKSKKEKKSKNETKQVAPTPQATPNVAAAQKPAVQTPQPVLQLAKVPLQQSATPATSSPNVSKATSIQEPTPVAKPPVQVAQSQPQTGTLQQPTAIPDFGQKKTGNPVIDDDITTII